MATILIIEDEPVLRRVVARLLHSAEHETLEAENGQQGIALAKQHVPDLILCDVLMPVMDGYKTLKALQGDPITAHIPFVFMTGKREMADLRRGMDFGADDYVTKPFTREELIAAVRVRLEKRQRLEQASEEKLDELRSKIMYVLPHELRTPLTAILGLADLLVDDAAEMDSERVTEVASGIADAAARLSRIIENYLVYSQIELLSSDESRRADVCREVLAAPAEVVTSTALKVARRREREQDLCLAADGNCAAHVSGENLAKAVEELIDNAFKFSKPGCTVDVRTSVTDADFTIDVVDRGRGMREDEIRRIGAYNQFRRDLYEQPGTGLGLVIAKGLTELHGGTFNISSDPGAQTAVRVVLRRAQG